MIRKPSCGTLFPANEVGRQSLQITANIRQLTFRQVILFISADSKNRPIRLNQKEKPFSSLVSTILSLLVCSVFDTTFYPVSYTHLDVYKRQVCR